MTAPHAHNRPGPGGQAPGYLTIPTAHPDLTGGVPPELVAAVVRGVLAALSSQANTASDKPANPSPMLTVSQAAALMGTSRATIIRKADAGELPCIVVSRGPRQKMRRFPRALIVDIAARGGWDIFADLKDHSNRWRAEVHRAQPRGTTEQEVNQ
jgi:excisionase family DNA binding protein